VKVYADGDVAGSQNTLDIQCRFSVLIDVKSRVYGAFRQYLP
jgi:hypothetical protein